MRVAAAQIYCEPGNLSANLAKIREFTQRAKQSGTELIVFPEMSDTGYSMSAIKKHATSWDEGAAPELQKIAKEFSVSIIAGLSDRDGSHIFNAQVLIDANGKILAKYRKTHLVTAPPLDERPVFIAGDEFVARKIGDFTIGLTICYDLRFPEVCRKLAVDFGANVLVNSSAWPFPRMEHLRILAMARAIENQSYLILANQAGSDNKAKFCGSSAIIDPYGVILAAASADREELLLAEISTEGIDSVRQRMAVFAHRRPELYK